MSPQVVTNLEALNAIQKGRPGGWRFKVPMSRAANLRGSASDPCLNAGAGSFAVRIDWARKKRT